CYRCSRSSFVLCILLCRVFHLLLALLSFPPRRSSDLARGLVRLVGGYCNCSDSGPALDLRGGASPGGRPADSDHHFDHLGGSPADRKSTRLNSSHGSISYAVFCLKTKQKSTHE